MILVKTFYAHNELRNYSYLIQDSDTCKSWVIDPFEASPIIDYIKQNGLVLSGILNTHDHFDHIRGNAPLASELLAPVLDLAHGDKIQLNSTSNLEVIATPGHTIDHKAFIWKQQNQPVALFSGDTLFNSGVGNCKNGGDVNMLYQTTKQLVTYLCEDTLLYPGHDYRKRNLEFSLKVEPENINSKRIFQDLIGSSSHELGPQTLKDEFQVNPFLRLNSDEIRHNVGNLGTTEKEIFIKLRILRDKW